MQRGGRLSLLIFANFADFPEVSREWIRKQLAMLKSQGLVSCQGQGVAAKWTYKGTPSL